MTLVAWECRSIGILSRETEKRRVKPRVNRRFKRLPQNCWMFLFSGLLTIWSSSAWPSPCAEEFGKISPARSESPIQRMYTHIHSQWDQTLRHEVVLRADGAHIAIGSLTLEDPVFITLFAKAVRSGEVATIDGGRVIGPKALNFILHITAMAPPGRKMKFTGSVSPMALHQTKDSQIAAMKKTTVSDPASIWTAAEIEKFENSLRKMKIEDACLKLWKTRDLRQCRNMKFELNSDQPDEIVWTRN